jgi:5'-deoxynucleotidase YfbR-like HD superfamily hydrolase
MVAKELKLDLDIKKSLMLALTHDLVEALAGDTDHSLIAFGIKTQEEKEDAELQAINDICAILPPLSGEKIKAFWHEYEEGKSIEAKYVKALDKIETIDHMVVIGSECFDHPELIAPYPKKAVLNYPPLIPMYRKLLERLKPEFEKKGWEWLDEYEV